MILETVNLGKNFGAIAAVARVNLRIGDGEVSSIIGPNGAGKSTLFNVITGLQKSDSGSVLFKGRDITRYPASRIAANGIVRGFQITNIFPRLTVFENVQIGAISRKRKGFNFWFPAGRAFKEEVLSALESVGLSDEVKSTAGALSYGTQKRLELAIALVTMPELLLLDEPTAGVSPAEAYRLMETINL